MTDTKPIRNADDLLNSTEAAAYLDMAVGTLYNLASQKRAPKRYRLNGGHPRYRVADLDAYRWQSSIVEKPRKLR